MTTFAIVSFKALSTRWLFVLSTAIALSASPAIHAGPLIIEEVARVSLPEPGYTNHQRAAIDGDHLILGASKFIPTDPADPAGGPDQRTQAAFLFSRTANGWQYVTKLAERTFGVSDGDEVEVSVAIKGGIASVALGLVHIFELTPSGWVGGPTSIGAGSSDVAIHNGTVIVSDGDCTWDARVIRKDSAGQWTVMRDVKGLVRGCDDEYRGGDVDIWGDRFIVANSYGEDPPSFGEARLYEGLSPQSGPPTILSSPAGPNAFFSSLVAIDQDTALVSGGLPRWPAPEDGIYVFQRQGYGTWIHQDQLQNPDYPNGASTSVIQFRDGTAVFGMPGDRLRGAAAGSVGIYQRDLNGEFRYVAKLVASDAGVGRALGRDVDISGNQVIAASGGDAYIFELPEQIVQPQIVQDDFESGQSGSWTPIAGSHFSVVSTGASQVYRQSSLAGDAGSLRGGTDWQNQSIQADVRPTEFNGPNRWFGLVTRYADSGNYYYVTVRSSNVVELKRIVNGAYQTLASAPLPVILNRNYRLRLEAVGTWLRVYVDGQLVAQARDSTHSQGLAGVFMYKTSADYDNVVVTPNPHTLLLTADFETALNPPAFWTPRQGSWSVGTDGSMVYSQTAVVGDARAVAGMPADDQILRTRVKPTALPTGGWVGLMARYQDDGNYYYVTVRSNNTISLRKLVNGGIHILDSAPMTVSAGTWYDLRLEAVGDALRVYVNNELVLGASDGTLASGRYGAVTYKASANYDDFSAVQP